MGKNFKKIKAKDMKKVFKDSGSNAYVPNKSSQEGLK